MSAAAGLRWSELHSNTWLLAQAASAAAAAAQGCAVVDSTRGRLYVATYDQLKCFDLCAPGTFGHGGGAAADPGVVLWNEDHIVSLCLDEEKEMLYVQRSQLNPVTRFDIRNKRCHIIKDRSCSTVVAMAWMPTPYRRLVVASTNGVLHRLNDADQWERATNLACIDLEQASAAWDAREQVLVVGGECPRRSAGIFNRFPYHIWVVSPHGSILRHFDVSALTLSMPCRVVPHPTSPVLIIKSWYTEETWVLCNKTGQPIANRSNQTDVRSQLLCFESGRKNHNAIWSCVNDQHGCIVLRVVPFDM